MNQLLIIGASGHGKVVADIAKNVSYTDIAFLDDDENVKKCGQYEVIGKCSDIREHPSSDFFVAIGNSQIRERIMNELKEQGLTIVTLIHPDAVIAEDVEIGTGTCIMAGVVVNPGTSIGRGCIINTGASVDHDNSVGDFVHVSVGSHLAGTITLGAHTWIGAGAVVSNNVNICSNVTVGAGAAVIHDIDASGIYIGVPAKQMIE